MPNVDSDGVRIHYRLTGSGSPLVLLHGYTASAKTQWELPGWVDFLAPRHRLLLVDFRGHGESEKPKDAGRYSVALMAGDALAAMDAAEIARADVAGYSMGAMVTMELLLEHAERFDRAVLGGMGAVFPKSGKENCADEEQGERTREFPNLWKAAKAWAYFSRHYDHRAIRAAGKHTFANGPVAVQRLGEIVHPVLSVSGTRDRFCPGTRLLAESIPDCRRVTIPGPGHVATVRDRRFKAAVAAFFAETPSRFR